MKVNKNSWHYKALKNPTLGVGGVYSWDISKSLCVYFWQVLGMILVKIFALLVILPFLVGCLVVLPLTSLLGWINTGVIVQQDLGFIALFVEGVALVLASFMFGVNKLKDIYKSRENGRDEEALVDKEPSLLVEYIKAKKKKLCPIIEFVGEK